jgi:phenylpropionate dioxygenase-like ring-hydroxylating dioxygenase large terminal subunit
MSSARFLTKEFNDINQNQLPIDWYVNPEVYALEQNNLFIESPQYIGHELMVANSGDFYTIDWMGNAKTLINQSGDISLISNVCRHRQALMLNGKGKTKSIVCPLHHWAYNLSGEQICAPQFEKNPCLHLNKTKLQNWQGLLFNCNRNIVKELDLVGCKQDFDFTGYKLDSVEIQRYDFNWKTFIEVYLEDYHVGPFHPGLSQFVDCNQLQWDFGEHFSVQTVGFKPEPLKYTSAVYQCWQNSVRGYFRNSPKKSTPKYGAIWMMYYPLLMVEWYPNVLVVSHIIPHGADACSNVVEFYYPEDIVQFEREYISAQIRAYNETAIEDIEICRRMHNGRKALYDQGIDERGPYQHPLETGLEHFHNWYRKQMERKLLGLY